MRILLIEDNRRLSDSLRMILQDDGYIVDTAFDGLEGEELATLASYDVILLDVMLPEKDGLAVCRSLRLKHVTTPVLMLTARDALPDRVTGLDSGADDYLVKPFEVDELRARIRALLRRESADKSALLRVGDLSLDPATHQVRRGERSIDLTAKEYALLEYLIRRPSRIVTRQMAEEHLWSSDRSIASNIVDVYIRRLRQKVEDHPDEPALIHTVRGYGYRCQ